MRSSDFLFHLIKSLSKGDRRNFKLYARLQDGDKKYIRLFDAIDKQGKYDEKKLLKQFKGERFTNQFSVAKNYLYNYILKTLDIFHQDKISELRIMLHKIEILIGKNLFEQAQKLLRKAKHAAERQERFGEMLELLNYERQILHQLQEAKAYRVFVSEIQRQEILILQKLENLQGFIHLYDKIYILRRKAGSARGETELAELTEILKHPLLKDESMALSVRARFNQLNILNDCYWFKQEFNKCLEYCCELVALFEKNNELRMEKKLRYLEILNNQGLFYYRAGNLPEALNALTKLRAEKVKTSSEKELIKIAELYFLFKISICMQIGNVSEGLQAIEDFQSEFATKLSGKIAKSIELTIYYIVSTFYIWSGKPSESLVWINKILNEPRTEFRTDLQCMTRILNLVAHLELGNTELVESNLKSTTRFLANRNRLFGFEKTTLKYLRQLSYLSPFDNGVEVLQSYQKDLEAILQDEIEQKALSLFDASTWIESKLGNTTMAEIEQRRASKEEEGAKKLL